MTYFLIHNWIISGQITCHNMTDIECLLAYVENKTEPLYTQALRDRRRQLASEGLYTQNLSDRRRQGIRRRRVRNPVDREMIQHWGMTININPKCKTSLSPSPSAFDFWHSQVCNFKFDELDFFSKFKLDFVLGAYEYLF